MLVVLLKLHNQLSKRPFRIAFLRVLLFILSLNPKPSLGARLFSLEIATLIRT